GVVPAGETGLPGRVGTARQLDEGEVGRRVRGAPRGARLVVGERCIRRGGADGGLVVPVSDERAGVAGVQATVVRRLKQRPLVAGGVVDHESGAEVDAADRDAGDGWNLVAPRIAI